MFKKSTLSMALIVVSSSAVLAQDADPAIDVNGDGFYSFPEITSVYPEVTDEMFTVMDTTGDGLLDMAEVTLAQESALLPAAQ